MPSRLTMLAVLAGGLYLGPFLGGLSRQPGWTVAAFAAALALWGALYRSGPWPRRLADLREPGAAAAAVLLLGLMGALAGLVFLAGRGLSVALGVLPLPGAVPLALPWAALAAAVVLLPPRRAAELDASLDDALRQLRAMPGPAAGPWPTPAADALVARLEALPDDAGEEEVRGAIAPGGFETGLLAVIDRLGAPPPRPARIAAILLATDPREARGLAGRAEGAWVFDLARGDPALEALFAKRALALLEEAPELWGDMPYGWDVAEAARATPDPEAARSLAALRDRLAALSPPEDGGGA